jgi:hypothetical protein
MQEEMIQMVDDDEIENVGIMSGFMDELEELISEIDAEDLEKNKGGDEADTAKLMGRTPNSPEILMNNLRGDMRSVDARREELADLVGMREAQETPEGVLTLLQSVLAQQEAVPPMPMAPPMPPQGMPPEMMGGMPPEMMGGMPPMPPQGMPPQGMGIESVMPDMPGMYRGGPVQNFNRGSGQMGVTPASDAFAAYPSDVVEEAKRRVRHMVDGGMVQKYNRGGVVQHFQDGSTPPLGVESAGRYPAEAGQMDPSAIIALIQAQSGVPTLKQGYDELLPLYQDILGSDPKDAQAQMLFDIGQAAFGYAGNVGADGRPMQGSAAARLSQSLGPLAGKIGARAGQMSKEGQALKMAALQGSQSERSAAQALEIERRKNEVRPMSAEEKTAYGITGEVAKYPWVMTAKGPDLPGGYPTPSTVPSPENDAWGDVYKGMVKGFDDTRASAIKALNRVPTLDALLELSPAIGSGMQQEVLLKLFPGSEGMQAATAYYNLVSGLLPEMRQPGSGAQSDKDIEVLRLAFASITQTPEVRSLTLQALKDKALIDGKRLAILDQLGQGEGQLDIATVQRQLNALATESVLSPELREMLSGILGKDKFDSTMNNPISTKTSEEVLAALTGPLNNGRISPYT